MRNNFDRDFAEAILKRIYKTIYGGNVTPVIKHTNRAISAGVVDHCCYFVIKSRDNVDFTISYGFDNDNVSLRVTSPHDTWIKHKLTKWGVSLCNRDIFNRRFWRLLLKTAKTEILFWAAAIKELGDIPELS